VCYGCSSIRRSTLAEYVQQIEQTQVPIGLGVMPVVRLKLFEFLKQHLSHSHFWRERLAWTQQDEQDEAGSPAPKELDKQLWQHMRAGL
jgi:hypothetical protein